MFIISFSGIDGSGKSTQIKLFKEYLHSKKIESKTIHIIKNSIANKIYSMFSFKKTRKKNKASASNKTDACIFSINLRKFFLFIDIIIFKIYYLLNKKKNIVLIFDRYFFDYLINIYYLEKRKRINLSPLLKDLLVKPDFPIYLKIDRVQANKRKKEQGLKYLERKIKLFKNLKKEFNFVEIYSEKNQQKEIARNIINHFNNLYFKK